MLLVIYLPHAEYLVFQRYNPMDQTRIDGKHLRNRSLIDPAPRALT